jgi:hypothetical protein
MLFGAQFCLWDKARSRTVCPYVCWRFVANERKKTADRIVLKKGRKLVFLFLRPDCEDASESSA